MLDDVKAQRVLAAIRRKRRPYTDSDVAMATGYSRTVVRRRLAVLIDAGLVTEEWLGERGPYLEAKPS